MEAKSGGRLKKEKWPDYRKYHTKAQRAKGSRKEGNGAITGEVQ